MQATTMQSEFDFDGNPAPGVADIPEGRAYFVVDEVAKMLKYSPDQIIKLTERGKLRFLNGGAGASRMSRRIPRAELVRFINENTY